MPKTTSIEGKEVLEALSVFKEPVTMDKIVRYVAKTYSQPEEKVKKLVEEALNGGVRDGLVQKHNEFYYRVCDVIDAINDESSEEDEDEIDSAESCESVDSGDVPSEVTPKKTNDGRTSGSHAPSRQLVKYKKVNKRDDRRSKKSRHIYSEEEENEDDFDSELRKSSHKCNNDCCSFHRRSSIDDHGYLRARSRSASRRR